MKIKIEFEIEETKEYVSFETELEEKENMYGECITFKDEKNGIRYVYNVGSMRMWKSKGNILCAEKVKLNWLNVEYKFN